MIVKPVSAGNIHCKWGFLNLFSVHDLAAGDIDMRYCSQKLFSMHDLTLIDIFFACI